MDDTTEIMGLVHGKSDKALTHKQEEFCRLVVQGASLSQAYRQSHHPPNMREKTVYEKASRLRAMGKIGARIEELRAPSVKKAQATYAEWLENVQRMAMFDPQILLDETQPITDAMGLEVEIDKDGKRTVKYKPSTKLSSLVLFGKATGFYQEKAALPMSVLEQTSTEMLLAMQDELLARKAAREAKIIEGSAAGQS